MVRDHFQNLIDAIEAERAAEESFYARIHQSENLSLRIQAGLVWPNVRVTRKHFTLGELLEIEVERTKFLSLAHKFKAGASAVIYSDILDGERYKGVISFVRKNFMRIIIQIDSSRKDEMLERGNINIELIYDPRPYMVMRESLHQVMSSDNPMVQKVSKALQDPIILVSEKVSPKPLKDNLPLNETQKEAVAACLEVPTIGIIHGPPGTGKTTTLVQLIRMLIRKEKRTLVCAPSNNATDLIAQICDQHGLSTLRLGNVTRIGDNIGHLTLAERARNHPEWKRIKKVKIEAENAYNEAQKYKRSFGEAERKHRSEMYREAKELKKWARELEDRLTSEIFQETQVVCTTLIGAANEKLNGLQFGTVIIDEASQAREPECWTAMLHAKRVILAGDHLQLPPTVKSTEARELGLETTLLDQLANKIPNTFLLREQYRMNEAIMSFSNKIFYGGQLVANKWNKNWKLKDDTLPLVLIDTSGCGYDENFNPEHKSYSNPGEFDIITKHLEAASERLAGSSIGIISPYAQQVRMIRDKISGLQELKSLNIDVDSIDGFQGQEKDIIYISFVRSNDAGKIGFLVDDRRLNVALTRAKKKLVIVGDISTLSIHPLFFNLAKHVEENGYYDTGWSYMDY